MPKTKQSISLTALLGLAPGFVRDIGPVEAFLIGANADDIRTALAGGKIIDFAGIAVALTECKTA